MRPKDFAVVLGATSVVAPFLCRQLLDAGYDGVCLSRREPAADTTSCAFPWRALDPETLAAAIPSRADVVSLLPIWVLPPLLPALMAARHIVVVSTTSVLAKAGSKDPAERELAQRIAAAEREICDFCDRREIGWTILRPTLIYDPGRDQNVSAIARFIRRFGFFPLAGNGRGLRQPVHADDVAQAIAAAAGNRRAHGLIMNLAGGETLSYRDMVRRIFSGLERRPIIISVPILPLRILFAVGRRVLRLPYGPALLDRMNQDLVFDDSPAREILSYRPRPFRPLFHAATRQPRE